MTKWSVKRPITTLVIFIVVLIMGFVSLSKLGLDVFPDITLPSLVIITAYPGANSEDVEKKITKVIEDEVATLPGIDKVESQSKENVSVVNLTYRWGTNIDAAASDVRDKLSVAQGKLPKDAQRPVLLKLSASMMPVLYMGISAKESYPELHHIVDKQIADRLKTVPGVGAVLVFGGLEREIAIDISKARLAAYNLTIPQIVGALSMNNITIPGGDIKVGSIDYLIRIPGEYRNVDEIGNLIVGGYRGISVYLKDVADIKDTHKEVTSNSRLNGYPSVTVMVQKKSGTNTVNVATLVRKKLNEIKKELPPDISYSIVMDSSDFIKRSIKNLATTVMWGGIFIFLVVLFFLRNLTGSIIVGLAMPFSLIIAFILLYFGHFTINIVSLSALAIAIGMVVDNAIVVFENIFRHRNEESQSAFESSVFGTSEVATAIIASTLTTIAIFVPLVFVKGLVSVMFKELAYAVSITLFGSLFTAFTLTPMLASKFLKRQDEERGLFGSFYNKTAGIFKAIENTYRRVLSWALSHRILTISIGLGIFIFSLLFARFIKSELTPEMDQGTVMGTVELPIGKRVEETDSVMRKVEHIVKGDVPERRALLTMDGSGGTVTENLLFKSGKNIGNIELKLVDKTKRKRSSKAIGYELANKIKKIPGVKHVDISTGGGMESFLGGKPIQIEVYGYDLNQMKIIAAEIKEKVEKIPGAINVKLSMESGEPEIWVNIDREKASSMGLNIATIGGMIRQNFYGERASIYREKGDEYDILVRLKPEQRTLDDLKSLMIPTSAGKFVPLANIAKIEYRKGPTEINRKNQSRVIYVNMDTYGRALGGVASDVEHVLKEMKFPKGIDVKIGGTAEEQTKSFRNMAIMLILGIILVYLVMAAEFETLLDPLIVMFSIPFAFSGVIWALFFTGKTLCLTSYLGAIMLAGIVVNNAIVLIDYINILRKRGMDVREAALLGGTRRLRPVLMTAVTTIFGLLPLALARGAGSETWSPLAIAVIGGLFFSTVVTLVFVPTLYSVIEEKVKGRRIFGR